MRRHSSRSRSLLLTRVWNLSFWSEFPIDSTIKIILTQVCEPASVGDGLDIIIRQVFLTVSIVYQKCDQILWAESFDVGQDSNLNLISFERLYQSIQNKINHCITFLSPTASWLIKSIEVSLTEGRNSLPSVTKTR